MSHPVIMTGGVESGSEKENRLIYMNLSSYTSTAHVPQMLQGGKTCTSATGWQDSPQCYETRPSATRLAPVLQDSPQCYKTRPSATRLARVLQGAENGFQTIADVHPRVMRMRSSLRSDPSITEVEELPRIQHQLLDIFLSYSSPST